MTLQIEELDDLKKWLLGRINIRRALKDKLTASRLEKLLYLVLEKESEAVAVNH